jgi:FkbH-like protein
MFQIEWAQQAAWEKEQPAFPPDRSQLRRDDVRRVYLLYWEDHCLECAPPLCYSSCALYSPRANQACSRFSYGIYPNPNFQGLFDFGADIRFQRWGKVQSIVYGKIASVRSQRLLDRINRFAVYHPDGAPTSHSPATAARSSNGSVTVLWKENLAKVRNKYFSWLAPARENAPVDEFVLECFSPDPSPFRLVLEYSVGNMTLDHTFVGEIKLRHSFSIEPGWNFGTLPAHAFGFGPGNRAGRITLYPENNAERRLIFTWLDLVQYRKGYKPRSHKTKSDRPAPAAKVKCVAWDLDNTLWKGILAEDSEGGLTPRPEALELIKKLDERGIIQTAVSKNNYADAWPVIGRLGFQDYFLYPAINWQPKSSNLKEIANRLNINIDTFALIDDSAFERAEVQSALPQVRVYSEEQIGPLLTYPEFDVPVSESSKNRRASYLTEIKREKVKEAFGGDYEAFLRSCGMKLRLLLPREEKPIARCLELIQRSNQLNLANTRYQAEEFRELLSRNDFLCVAMDCSDRFGDYGIVGFASIDESRDPPTLRDLVLSCRVAQKRVEHTFIQWLARRELGKGKAALAAELVKTERNQPICQVFEDLHFRPRGEENSRVLMELPLDRSLVMEDIVTVETADGL